MDKLVDFEAINADLNYAKYTGLDYSDIGLKPRFKVYFDVVRDNELIPEIREMVGVPELAGVVLAVRDTPPA